MNRLSSPRIPWVVAVGFLAVAAAPVPAAAQQVTVTGIVVERAHGSWIGGATVRLSGSPAYFTELDGAFRFTRVGPGRHTLTVEAMGYRPRSLELVIRADTALIVELEPDPIRLDSLLVQGGTVRIQGNLFDATTGLRVLQAQVTVVPGYATSGARRGRFTLRRVPKGRSLSVLVEAIEYLPARIALITQSDTTLSIEMEPDSVAIRMMAQAVERLGTRSDAVPLYQRVFGRNDLNRVSGWSLFEMIRFRNYGKPPSARCLFIDDVQQRYPEILQSYSADEVERVEIFGRGKMIRVYTKAYVAGMFGKAILPAIVYLDTPLGPVCR